MWDSTAECVAAVKAAGYQLVVTHLSQSSVTIQVGAVQEPVPVAHNGPQPIGVDKCIYHCVVMYTMTHTDRKRALLHRPCACNTRGLPASLWLKVQRVCGAHSLAGGGLDSPHRLRAGQREARREPGDGGGGGRDGHHTHGALGPAAQHAVSIRYACCPHLPPPLRQLMPGAHTLPCDTVLPTPFGGSRGLRRYLPRALCPVALLFV